MVLSILIVTMNRADQLTDAVKSCLACSLPDKTEFIIVDNASTDNTTEAIQVLKTECKYPIKYLRSEKNLGVGGGRNFALEQSTGDYIYVLDDDATIDDGNKNFFLDAIKIFENNREYATLTTQIYDLAWKANRLTDTKHKLKDSIFEYYMPCGGSHFLRRAYFDTPIYFPNIYGYEEIPTALQAVAKGYKNVYCSDLLVIHRPKVNKWSMKSNPRLYINSFASQYAIKKSLYPSILTPLLWTIYQLRYYRYLRGTGLQKEGKEIINNLTELGKGFKRISIAKWWKQYKLFGTSVI